MSALTRRRTGVGNYLYHQLQATMARAGAAVFHGLSTGRGDVLVGNLRLASHRHVLLPTRAMYKMWETLGRPRADELLSGVDLFHATNYFLPPVKKCARVVTFYDLTFLKHPEWCSPKIVSPFSRNIRRFAREADAIMTCSEASKMDIAEELDVSVEKVHVAYGAVDEIFRPVDRDEAQRFLNSRYRIERPYFLFVSTLEPRKNVGGLLQAFEMVAKVLPHDLVLVGQEGWSMGHLEESIARHPAAKRINRIGYVEEREDLPQLYAGAEALVLPSWYEGFGLPVLEAMRCGCPVITSPRSSLPEVGGEAALYVAPESPEAIGAAMIAVATDAQERGAMIAKGFAQAERFSWEGCGEATWRCYESALACASS